MRKIFTKERLCAFADAILAIIMTILVLELPKPDALTWENIWDLKTSFIAFAVSFFSLAVLWADWHREWHSVKAISDKTVWSMMIVLFFMAFMPYITGLLASELKNSVGQILYGADLLLVSLFNSLVYRSLAAIEENKEIRETLIARANLLFINTAIMLVCVILSMTVLSYCSIIGIMVVSVLFVLPIFKR
ncbi:MAG: DUF1211 domain-containing protein [Clostridia bacterium]|nr:DUF1211 domain-containing protein [Clostridia bacterium]